MKMLALETATAACSVAIWMDDEVIERYELAPRQHARLILPMIDSVLADTGLSRQQLDALAVGHGPGSFTGLRIAVGVAQGLAYALDIPVVTVSTLAAIARGVMLEQDCQRVAVALDARMQEVYWGLYHQSPEEEPQLEGVEGVYAPGQTPLPENHNDWCAAGDGWHTYGEQLKQRLSPIACWETIYPRAGDVAALGALRLQRGEAQPAAQALPVYLRDRVVNTPPSAVEITRSRSPE